MRLLKWPESVAPYDHAFSSRRRNKYSLRFVERSLARRRKNAMSAPTLVGNPIQCFVLARHLHIGAWEDEGVAF